MKKKLLFVNESLTLAGGEKSLIALLSNLDSDKYEIDLQLFRFGGELEQFIPDYVKILPPIKYFEFLKTPILRLPVQTIIKGNLKFLIARLRYSLKLRKGNYKHSEKAQFFWESANAVINRNKKKYDVAIAYAQGIPTFYVIDKINANQKIAWINANMEFENENRMFNYYYYKSYDYLVSVSQMNKKHLLELFPEFNEKTEVIYDIIDYKSISNLAIVKKIKFETSTFNILTVSRIDSGMKGIDLLAESCRILRDRGVNFHWYLLGTGDYKNELIEFIKENHLEERLTLLGTDKNPYPYYKAADLYVQTSRSESYGIALAEARLLNLPIVTTRFDTVFEQMINEKNGLVVDINPEAIAEGIQKLINDKTLYDSIVDYLKSEPKENLESVEKFDQLITK